MGCKLKYLVTLFVALAHSWKVKKCISGHSNIFSILHNVYKNKRMLKAGRAKNVSESWTICGLVCGCLCGCYTSFQLDCQLLSCKYTVSVNWQESPGSKPRNVFPCAALIVRNRADMAGEDVWLIAYQIAPKPKKQPQKRHRAISDRVKWDHTNAQTPPLRFRLNSPCKYPAEFAEPWAGALRECELHP